VSIVAGQNCSKIGQTINCSVNPAKLLAENPTKLLAGKTKNCLTNPKKRFTRKTEKDTQNTENQAAAGELPSPARLCLPVAPSVCVSPRGTLNAEGTSVFPSVRLMIVAA
jgi:hypothetical protein